MMPKIIIDMVGCYSSITSNCPINQLSSPFTYYLSDHVQSNIYCRNLIMVDLKSAYPSICKIYFGEYSDFTKEVFSKVDKLERNKFISINLKNLYEKDGNNYIFDFNVICKLIILGYIYTKFNNVTIIEYIKDGVIIKYNSLNSDHNINHVNFLKFIEKYNLIFHEDVTKSYVRFHKTTILENNDMIEFKGIFKNIPYYILTVIKKFLDGNIYNQSLLNDIKLIYSYNFSRIIILSNMIDEINLYYSFNGEFLDSSGNLSNIHKFDSKAYLVYVIYPILSLLRFNSKNI